MISRGLFKYGALLLAVVAVAALLLWRPWVASGPKAEEGILGRVGRHIILPADEEPAILTVTDTTKLETEFLKQAQNGDRVLVYQLHKKAYIYRPSNDIVVDVAQW